MNKNCGPYRTIAKLDFSSRTIESGHLVYGHFHAHEAPTLHLPIQNKNNRWLYAKDGLEASEDQCRSLAALKAEGIYRLREHFHPDETHVVAAQSVVQLGYNRQAQPIIFFPTWDTDRNALVFPVQGTRIPPEIYKLLEPLQTRGPKRAVQLH